MKLSKYEMVPAHCISHGEMQTYQQLHPKDGARSKYHTFVHIAIATLAPNERVQKTRQLRMFEKQNTRYVHLLWPHWGAFATKVVL